MASSTCRHLSEVLRKGDSCYFQEHSIINQKNFSRLHWGKKAVLLAVHLIINLGYQHHQIYDEIERLNNFASCCFPVGFIREISRFAEMYVSLVDQLEAFFEFPMPQMSNTFSRDHLLVVFVEFLLGISREVHGGFDNKRLFKLIEMELRFLITFLGDKTISYPPDQLINADIEAVADRVGRFLYAYLFVDDEDDDEAEKRFDSIYRQFEDVKAKIKHYCSTLSMLTKTSVITTTAPNTAVISLCVVDSVLDDLKYLINHEEDGGRINSDLKNQISTILDDFSFLQSLVRHRVTEIEKHPQLQQLVIRITDVAHEVDYIINSYAPDWYLINRFHHVEEKIGCIRLSTKQLESETGEVAKYPIQKAPSQARNIPSISHDIVVGFKDEEMKIADQLTRGPMHRQIISICGMAGLGKTTLAKKIFNDPCIICAFDKRAWCVASQTHQRRNMLVDILRSTSGLDKEIIMKMDEGDLAEDVYKSLKGYRYLIVMDDMWNINAWDDLRRLFPDDKNHSRILFTSRLQDVALQASPSSVVNQLHFLSKAECLDLLLRKVFPEKHCPAELQDVAEQIAANCQGLPIAVVVISAVLANMEKEKSLWQQVATSLSSRVSEDPTMCTNILKLSYQHLPVHLKPCFLYFAMFEEDTEVPVRKLISLWIAEGFIEKHEQRSLETAAHEYLKDLIDRSLLLVSKRRYDGGVKTCRIHDLLHDMCLKIAEEGNFLKVIKDQLPTYEQNHRLRIHSMLPYQRCVALHIRSVFGNLSYPSKYIIWSSKSARIFDLSAVEFKIDDYDDAFEIELPPNLRYLVIPCTLPSMKRLEKLEFLRVDNKEMVEVPDILLYNVNLRHMHFNGNAEFSESCRERAANDTSFPINNLERVSVLFISDEKDEKILRFSPHLRRLKCKITAVWDSSKCKFRYPSFDFLNQLESLSLSFHRRYIASMYSYRITSLPSNLKKLSLRDFDLHLEEMGIIGRLSNLEVLKLQNCDIAGQQWNTNEDEFLELRFFELNGVMITEWNASMDHFPKLERIVLRKCNHLNKIPSDLGKIPTLQMIEVHGCKKSVGESAMQIEKEQRDDGNDDLKVIVSHSQLLRRRLENLEKLFGRSLKTIL